VVRVLVEGRIRTAGAPKVVLRVAPGVRRARAVGKRQVCLALHDAGKVQRHLVNGAHRDPRSLELPVRLFEERAMVRSRLTGLAYGCRNAVLAASTLDAVRTLDQRRGI